MPRKIHKLKVDDQPTVHIAISCSETRLRLAWMFNESLGFQIREIEPIAMDESTLFPAQVDDSSFPEITLLLVKNRSEGRVLVKELPNIDFILRVQGDFSASFIKETIKKIRELNGVVAAIEVDPKRAKGLGVLAAI